jgi:pimeloyl-ACP methyl ester carboxylesterase
MLRVMSADGAGIAVYESGDRANPTIVAVHGYPDNHTVWDGVAARLADRFHVVTYDVRGAGESEKPKGRGAYRMARLVDDFTAVIDAVSPAAPVHVLAHDWGSIQCWAAVTDPRLAERIASFTSMSGPSLDHAGAWVRDVRAHPRGTLRQLAHSYYIALMQLPLLPELVARHGIITRGVQRAGAATSRQTADDALHGVQLYRANMLSRLGRPRPARTDIPVQVLAPEHDPFVSPTLQCEAPAPFVANLSTRTIDGGHWVVSQRPELIARLTSEFIQTQTAQRVS